METALSKFNVENVLHDGIGKIELIQYTGTDKIVVNAARASYGQDNSKPFDKRDAKLLNFLLEHDHSSVLEHTYVTFVVDAPIFIARQWMRHRMSSFNEISLRYVEVKEDQFYTPKVARLQSKNNKQASYTPSEVVTFIDSLGRPVEMPFELWNSAVASAFESAYRAAYSSYKEILGLGVAREIARGVIPAGQYTRFYYSANLRSLLHFCDLRLAEGAQWEIKQYANTILDILRELYPNTIAAWENRRSTEGVQKEEVNELAKILSGIDHTISSLSENLKLSGLTGI